MVTMDKLQAFFIEHPKVALAFSGGADSAYLLWAAKHFGADVRAYCVVSQFQPAFELEHARRLAGELGAEMRLLQVDALADEDVARFGNLTAEEFYPQSLTFRFATVLGTTDSFLMCHFSSFLVVKH